MSAFPAQSVVALEDAAIFPFDQIFHWSHGHPLTDHVGLADRCIATGDINQLVAAELVLGFLRKGYSEPRICHCGFSAWSPSSVVSAGLWQQCYPPAARPAYRRCRTSSRPACSQGGNVRKSGLAIVDHQELLHGGFFQVPGGSPWPRHLNDGQAPLISTSMLKSF